MSFEARTNPIQRWNLAFSAGAVATSAAVASPVFAVSVALGAAIEAINFRGLSVAAGGLFAGQIAGRGLWTAFFAVRFLVLATVLLVAIRHGAEPVGLVIGLSTILPAALLGAWRVRPPVEDHELVPAPPPDDPSWDQWNPWLARESRARTDEFGDDARDERGDDARDERGDAEA